MSRIVIAAPMKSGSTFVSRVLAKYLAVADYKPFFGWGWQDHILLPETLNASPDSFVMQAHLKPSRPNRASIIKHDLQVICLWRNLGDVVISLAEHIANESHEIPVCYIPDRKAFLINDIQVQYTFLVQMAIPWYLAFWELWHSQRMLVDVRFFHFEKMLDNPMFFFSEIVSVVQPLSVVDPNRLQKCMEWADGKYARKNVGMRGRSAELLSEGNKRLIERTIAQYCSLQAQSSLLSELPWVITP